MLAWVVIDRTYSRQFLPKSSSPRTLYLCVEFSDSFRPTSVVPTTYALPVATAAPQPLCNQSVTHSFYLDGGCVPLPTFEPSNVPTCFRAIPSLFRLLRTLLHFFAVTRITTHLFSSDSALFAKKHGEWRGDADLKVATAGKLGAAMCAIGGRFTACDLSGLVSSGQYIDFYKSPCRCLAFLDISEPEII